jgi:ubiquinone/menaquinone biosynthesis C-methylase UbiE
VPNNSESVFLKDTITKNSSPLLFRVFDGLANLPYLKKAIIWGWYQYLSTLDRDADMTFMNYGYVPLVSADPRIELRDEDMVNRYSIQLYHRVAAAIDLEGKDLLEVGCGRGGGASFIMRSLRPRSMTGIDFSTKAVAFCKSYYQQEGLSFFRGDAEHIPFPAASFDAVINLESSHCYNSMKAFLREVVRVLRPNGYFLFADFRLREAVPVLHEQLKQSGLCILEEEQITANVLKALEFDNERKLALIQSKAPKFIRERLQQFAGLMGSPVHQKFLTGEWEYLRFVLRKA